MASRIFFGSRPMSMSMSRYMSRSRSIFPIAVATGLSASFLAPHIQYLRCDSSGSITSKPIQTSDSYLYKNRSQIRQVSTGSISGFVSGVALGFLSKPLALLIGLIIAGIYSLQAAGIHVIPYQSIQRYFKNCDIKGALLDNLPFKLAFGITCSLASFGSF